ALGWGFVARRVGAQDDTVRHSVVADPLFTGGGPVTSDTDVQLGPAGPETGGYVSDRVRASRSWGLELGARWDRQTLVPEQEISPRVNLVWSPALRSALRLGWGRVSQPQGPQELQVEDGATAFLPAERAEHRTINFDHLFASGLALSVGA